jgi:hypothetical protein
MLTERAGGPTFSGISAPATADEGQAATPCSYLTYTLVAARDMVATL